MEAYQEVGEMITETIRGEVTHGTIVEYLTMNFDRTGEAGKEMDTGETNEIGVPKVDIAVGSIVVNWIEIEEITASSIEIKEITINEIVVN